MAAETTHEDEVITRIYEAGYHIVPTVKEEDVEKVVSGIRSEIEKLGGSFIAEAAPALMKLSFDMDMREGERHVAYDRGYFGWIKFEAGTHAAKALTDSLKVNSQVLRALVFKTVREDTRAKFKAPQLREVKRSEMAKSAPRKVATEEDKTPVSEVDLDKALETLTQE
jgi:ribosomal protein S6